MEVRIKKFSAQNVPSILTGKLGLSPGDANVRFRSQHLDRFVIGIGSIPMVIPDVPSTDPIASLPDGLCTHFLSQLLLASGLSVSRVI